MTGQDQKLDFKLLEASLVENEDSRINYNLKTYKLGACPPYSVLTLLPVDDAKLDTSEGPLQLPNDIQEALHHAATPIRSKLFWIEQVCIDQRDDGDLRQQAPLIRQIHMNATHVQIWAGNATSPDFMDTWIGPNTEGSVQEAFEFAHMLASVDVEDIISTIREVHLKGEYPSWFHLTRILYRPWFRGLDLLRSRYIEDLSHAAVLCGNSTAPWKAFNLAAKRLRAAKPAPAFLLNPVLGSDGEIVERDTYSMLSGGDWFRAQLRFGSHVPPYLLGRLAVYALASSSEEMHDFFMAVLGYVADEYHADEGLPGMPELIEELDEKGEETVPLSDLEVLSEPPSLPFDGKLYPYLNPEERKSFVHEYVNRRTTATLVKLLPHHGMTTSPIQCAIVQARFKDMPEFKVVLNTALRPFTTKSTILVNGQSFIIPSILELFLRTERKPEEEQIFFVWQLCMPERQLEMKSRADLEYCTLVHALMSRHAKGFVNLYDVLDQAVGMEEVQKSVPEGKGWEEWLLELNS